jgi:ABC-2 type transport system permease protein
MQVLINAFANGSSSLIQSKYTGNIIFLLMAPISPFAFYSAYLAASILRGVVVGIAVYLSIIWFGAPSPHNLFIACYYLVMGAAITGGFGLIAGIVSDKFEQLAAFQSFVIVPLVYLAGIFFNPTNLSPLMQKLSSLDPFLYIIDGFRYGLIGGMNHSIITMVVVLMVALIVNAIGYSMLLLGFRIKN